MFIRGYLFVSTMGKKVNIWLDDTTLGLWEKIPSGERSALIKTAIRTNSTKEPSDPRSEMIKIKIEQLENTNLQIENLQKKRTMIEMELSNLHSDKDVLKISKSDFWKTITKRATTQLEHPWNMNYRSYSGKSKYSIFSVENNKIYIRNIRTGRTNSNFSKKTTDLAIDRLIAYGGKIPVGLFIPVKMHEYTVVSLHPRLMEKDGFVFWIKEEVIQVTESMIPEHKNQMPPKEWVSNENFLAVLIDGKKALIGVGRKIVIFFREDHYMISQYEEGDMVWQTKHYSFNGPGLLHWGHQSDTQKIVMIP